MAENRTLAKSDDILLHHTEEFLHCHFDHLKQVVLSNNTSLKYSLLDSA